MKISKLIIILSCLMTALACSAAKYQIKVLNTPTITIDNREAKVGDWFTDESVIVWSQDNQAMRVVSDENKVYTLSAKLYKEAKARKFSDFILYTKPLAARGTKDLDLIEQLAERFDQDFIMLDEIIIDLSDIDLPEDATLEFTYESSKKMFKFIKSLSYNLIISKSDIKLSVDADNYVILSVSMNFADSTKYHITKSFEIEIVPNSL